MAVTFESMERRMPKIVLPNISFPREKKANM